MILALDLGGTKLASALFTAEGEIVKKSVVYLQSKSGKEVGKLITDHIKEYFIEKYTIHGIGLSVPGISRNKTGTVWAPNIPGWEDYAIIQEIKSSVGDDIIVEMDSDRACGILGEVWKGNAIHTQDAIFLTIGTGIGAGILVNGQILRGSNDIAGAIGWMALDKPFHSKYVPCGCFEYYASGDGIVRMTNEIINSSPQYDGILKQGEFTAHDVFNLAANNDLWAVRVLQECIVYWGMACANLISIFNPEKIIFGGGVFGPAIKYIDDIKQESIKWAQPISMTQVQFLSSALDNQATLYGAAYLALKSIR
ncbi:MAG: ROK family protein [Saprospiraceae bacterium]|nr:ROK family protein [Saprospiraceae bacterium]